MINFFKTKILPSRAVQLWVKTLLKWQQDRCLEMGASLSYYALFSLFPILLVIASILGFLLGPNVDTFDNVLTFARNSLPPEAFEIVKDTLLKLNHQSVEAGGFGFLLMLFTASNVFGALDRSVDRIWKLDRDQARSNTLMSSTSSFICRKLLAFGLVISSSILLLLSLLSNIAIGIGMEVIGKIEQNLGMKDIDHWLIAKLLQFSSSFLILSLTLLLLLQFLSSTFIPWKDLWSSALVTTVLLLGVQQSVSHNVIHIGSQYHSYGVIGSVMILMLWNYFTCQIFLFGCEFAYVYAHLFGSRRHRELEL